MAKIIPLATYKQQTVLRAVSRYWGTLFEESFDADTRLSDLGPKTLCFLAEPGEKSSAVLYSLIIGLSGYGETTTFESLESQIQSHILDIHLFLSDQIRFEMMFRLKWIERFAGNQNPLIQMVTEFHHIRNICQAQPPSLARSHEAYSEYANLFERDQQVFIRRMTASALETFKLTNRLK